MTLEELKRLMQLGEPESACPKGIRLEVGDLVVYSPFERKPLNTDPIALVTAVFAPTLSDPRALVCLQVYGGSFEGMPAEQVMRVPSIGCACLLDQAKPSRNCHNCGGLGRVRF